MSVIDLLVAFGGGIFGSVVGGTVAFIFTGIVALIGLGLVLATGNDLILTQIVFGPFLGPHVAFAGAAAAAAFAGRKKLADGSDVDSPLFKLKDSTGLLIGGGVGIIGFLINYLLNTYTFIKLDSIAATVTILGILTRLFIAGSPLRINDSQQNHCRNDLIYDCIWGFGISLAVAYAVILTGLPNLGWAISAVSLIFIYTNHGNFPISHHITMVSGYAAITFNNVLIAALFGLGSVLIGDIIKKTINTNFKSHIDMPAVVLTLMSLLILAFQ